MNDPCQRLFDDWSRVADKTEKLRQEIMYPSVLRQVGRAEFIHYVKAEVESEYKKAKAQAERLHEALGKCYEKAGVI